MYSVSLPPGMRDEPGAEFRAVVAGPAFRHLLYPHALQTKGIKLANKS